MLCVNMTKIFFQITPNTHLMYSSGLQGHRTDHMFLCMYKCMYVLILPNKHQSINQSKMILTLTSLTIMQNLASYAFIFKFRKSFSKTCMYSE